MTTAPTADQIRAYLLANGWHKGESGRAAYLMVALGHTVRMLHEPTEYDRGKAVFDIALAERRHPADVREAILAESAAAEDAEKDFLGCARDCRPRTEPASRWVHTLVWGRCAMAVEPPVQPATINIPRTWIADDGYPSFGWEPVPLTLFAPWAEYLSAADQHDMLKDVADADPHARAGIVEAWRRTADRLADPARREVLLGEFDPDMFVESARPGGDDDA